MNEPSKFPLMLAAAAWIFPVPPLSWILWQIGGTWGVVLPSILLLLPGFYLIKNSSLIDLFLDFTLALLTALLIAGVFLFLLHFIDQKNTWTLSFALIISWGIAYFLAIRLLLSGTAANSKLSERSPA